MGSVLRRGVVPSCRPPTSSCFWRWWQSAGTGVLHSPGHLPMHPVHTGPVLPHVCWHGSPLACSTDLTQLVSPVHTPAQLPFSTNIVSPSDPITHGGPGTESGPFGGSCLKAATDGLGTTKHQSQLRASREGGPSAPFPSQKSVMARYRGMQEPPGCLV